FDRHCFSCQEFYREQLAWESGQHPAAALATDHLADADNMMPATEDATGMRPGWTPAPDFWRARPALTHILEFARARRAGPWAVLGVVLARVVAATEPNIVLPPVVGSAKSTNMFVALVGPSGGGKGAAEGAAADAVEFIGSNSVPVLIEEFPVGSGE